jgi:hypothetical protein
MKYESLITCYLKDIANVQVFAESQTDRQAKNYMPPIFRYKTNKQEAQGPHCLPKSYVTTYKSMFPYCFPTLSLEVMT